jgi:hypothetical protein
VLFDGVGWVPFHPLPKPNAKPRPVEEDFRPEPETSTPPPDDAPTLTAAPTSPAASGAAGAAGDRGGASTPTVLAGLTGSALVLALAGYAATVPLLRRAQRRRRLDDPDPRRRVAGAWLELTDALRLAGRPPGAHLAATEVAAYARARLATADPATAPVGVGAPVDGGMPTVAAVRAAVPPLDELAHLVNVGAFAGAVPDPGRAGPAQEEALAYVRRLRAGQPWWRRVLWSLHPGPLRWHR